MSLEKKHWIVVGTKGVVTRNMSNISLVLTQRAEAETFDVRPAIRTDEINGMLRVVIEGRSDEEIEAIKREIQNLGLEIISPQKWEKIEKALKRQWDKLHGKEVPEPASASQDEQEDQSNSVEEPSEEEPASEEPSDEKSASASSVRRDEPPAENDPLLVLGDEGPVNDDE